MRKVLICCVAAFMLCLWSGCDGLPQNVSSASAAEVSIDQELIDAKNEALQGPRMDGHWEPTHAAWLETAYLVTGVIPRVPLHQDCGVHEEPEIDMWTWTGSIKINSCAHSATNTCEGWETGGPPAGWPEECGNCEDYIFNWCMSGTSGDCPGL